MELSTYVIREKSTGKIYSKRTHSRDYSSQHFEFISLDSLENLRKIKTYRFKKVAENILKDYLGALNNGNYEIVKIGITFETPEEKNTNKHIMKVIDNYWVDKNNNKWDIDSYTEEEACECSKSLEKCANCVNCIICTKCFLCEDCSMCGACTDCDECNKCTMCVDCDRCSTCDRCKSCLHCTNCTYLECNRGKTGAQKCYEGYRNENDDVWHKRFYKEERK